MINEKDRVAVRHQVVHHGLEPVSYTHLIEVGHERTKGGEKRQEDDQKGTGVSRRALFVNGCHFCSVLVRCGCRMRRRRIERRLGLRVDDPIPSANLVRILRLA